MKTDRKKPYLRYVIVVAVILLVLIATLLVSTRLVLPDMIAGAVRDRIAQRLGSRLTFAHVSIELLPRPSVILRDSCLAVDHTVQVQIQDIEVVPSISALIQGRFEPVSVVFRRVDGHVTLPAALLSGESAPKSDDLYAKWLTRVAEIGEAAPDMVVRVEEGLLEFSSQSGGCLRVTDVNAVADLGKRELSLACRSDAWQQLQADLNLDPQGFSGCLKLDIQALSAAAAVHWFPTPIGSHVADGRADLNVQVTFQRDAVWEAQLGLTAPFWLLQQNGRQQPIEDLRVQAKVRSDGTGWALQLDRLSSTAPSLQLSAKADMTHAPGRQTRKVEVSTHIDHAALEPIRKAALILAGDIPAVVRVAGIVQGGILDKTRLSTLSPTDLSELGQPRHWQVQGRLEEARLRIPGIDLPLRGVSGDIRLKDGILFGQHVTARTPGARAQDGQIALALFNGSRHFKLNADVDADLEQVLGKVRKWTAIPQLQNLSQVSGRARGRLVLGDSLDDLKVQVHDARIVDAAGHYQGLAHPVQISRAVVSVMENRLSVEDAHIIFGENQLRGLDGQWSWQAADKLQVSLDSAEIVVQEALPWFKRIDALASPLAGTQAKGKIQLGPSRILRPSGNAWQILARGRVNRIRVEDPRLPSPATIGNAKLKVEMDSTGVHADFSQADVAMLDSRLTLTGRIHSQQNRLAQIHLESSGRLSTAAANWLREQLDLPATELARAMIQITRSELQWNTGAGVLIQTDLQYGRGPIVSLDLRHQDNVLDIRKLVISDEHSMARMSGRRQADDISLSFRGNMDGRTLARIFPALQAQAAGTFAGDFQARVNLGRQPAVRVQGYLVARELLLPFPLQHGIILQDIAVHADQDSAFISSGDIVLNDQPIQLTGRIDMPPSNLRLDLLLKAEKLSLQTIQSLFSRSSRPQTAPADPGRSVLSRSFLNGEIRFEVARFLIEPYSLSSLNGTILLQDGGVSVHLAHARMCHILLPGEIVRQTGGRLEIDLRLLAQDRRLSDTLACLFEKKAAVTGTFDLQTRLNASGSPEELPASLNGTVDFSAVDGRIDKLPLLARIFAFLNVTEIVAGKLPQLNTEGLPYEKVTVQGKITSGILEIETLDLDGPSVEIGSYGTFNLLTRQIDLVVTVAPLKTVDRIIKKVPVLRTILGGNLLAIPVRVKGHVDDPQVVPLDPTAIGENLFNMLKRTFTMPVKLFKLDSAESRDQEDK